MESITIKVDEQMAKAMEKAMKPLYSTKTEFIREAIRDKIKEQEKKEVAQILKENFGKYRHMNISDKDLRHTREEVSKELLKKYNLEYTKRQ